VDYLFSTVYRYGRVTHVLCNGYQRSPHGHDRVESTDTLATLPLCNAATMSDGPWQTLLDVLGKDGDKVMLDLILHCGIYLPIPSGRNNLYQLSGL
jgi:telomerase reverse transcriptase